MVTLHPVFLTAPGGERVAVQVPAAEWEAFVLDRWQVGEITAGRAAELLGVPVAGFLALAGRRGLVVLTASADVAAELAAAGE